MDFVRLDVLFLPLHVRRFLGAHPCQDTENLPHLETQHWPRWTTARATRPRRLGTQEPAKRTERHDWKLWELHGYRQRPYFMAGKIINLDFGKQNCVVSFCSSDGVRRARHRRIVADMRARLVIFLCIIDSSAACCTRLQRIGPAIESPHRSNQEAIQSITVQCMHIYAQPSARA